MSDIKPKYRFPEFKDDWQVISLNNALKTGIEKNNEEIYKKEDMLSVSSSAGVVNQMEYKGRSFAGKSVAPYNILKKGQVVYTKSPLKEFPYGIIKYNTHDDGIVSTLYAVYSIKNGFCGDFIDYYFQLPDRINKYLKPLVNIGAKNDMKVNNDKVLIDSVIFPENKIEQQKIALFLTVVDDKINSLSNKQELLKEYKKEVTQKLFSGVIRFKEFSGEAISWTSSYLGDITEKTGKKNKNNIPYPVYSINNKEGFLPQSDQFEDVDSNERGYDISMYKIIDKHTFAYNPARINVGSIGYSGELENIIISSLYVCFKTSDEIEDTYLLQYVKSPKFNKLVRRYAEGGVRSYLFYENLSKIKVPHPKSKTEQIKIANFLSTIDEKIEAVGNQLKETEEWKKGLLQKMFC